MPNIIELDQNLINKIAAGEVIERPASVVKELVENSMDAGATSITVEIAEGGKSLIKITDDGHGIEADELPTAIKRHSTSKIKSAEDLFNISTLGFRGEALASIGSVSYMKITSKIKSADSAQLIEVEDGRLITNKPAAANNGTTIEVNNLFFNVPARKKHQKSMQAEFRHILDIITRYILINPQIQFKLIHNDKIVITSPSSTNTLANVATVYGRSITKSLVPINFSFFDIEIMGFISKPELTRADRTYQSIYVNKRHIKNSTVQRAVYDGYGELLFHGRHPIFILDIKIDPQKIDVNVHPQKSEIRIQKEQELYSAVRNAIISAFSDEKLIPQIQEFKTKLVDQKLIITDKDDFGKSQSTLSSHASTSHSDEESDEKAETKSELRIKLIGKLHNTYVIAQDEEGMLLVDQHAAHERVMYEKLLNDFKNDSIKVQELISPLMIEANPNEKLIIEGNIELLKSLGIMIEQFGKSTFVIRALPNILQKQQTPALINDIIDELNNDELKKITKINGRAHV